MITVAELAADLLALPADLQDKPVAVYSDTDEGGDLVGPGWGRSDHIVVQRLDDPDSLLYYQGESPQSGVIRDRDDIPVMVTITG